MPPPSIEAKGLLPPIMLEKSRLFVWDGCRAGAALLNEGIPLPPPIELMNELKLVDVAVVVVLRVVVVAFVVVGAFVVFLPFDFLPFDFFPLLDFFVVAAFVVVGLDVATGAEPNELKRLLDPKEEPPMPNGLD
jgi:hypothetical protein